MAKQEHLDILRKGVQVWNEWRHENREIRPELYGANLSNASLSYANLSDANLHVANLSRADLHNADLHNADFYRAILCGADLNSADLRDAEISYAFLSGIDLSGTDFMGARLQDANLADAMTGRTVFANNDLSSIKGLDEVRHFGPSTIGVDTIYKSGGNIPRSGHDFGEGCPGSSAVAGIYFL